jgi:hypothetical protein
MNPIVEAHAADPIMGRAFRELADRPEDSAAPLAWHRDLTRDVSTPQRPDPLLVAHLPPLLADCLHTIAEAQIRASTTQASADVNASRLAENLGVNRTVPEPALVASPHLVERGR